MPYTWGSRGEGFGYNRRFSYARGNYTLLNLSLKILGHEFIIEIDNQILSVQGALTGLIGKQVKILYGPATVNGESLHIMPLADAGKALRDDDPESG